MAAFVFQQHDNGRSIRSPATNNQQDLMFVTVELATLKSQRDNQTQYVVFIFV